MKERAGAHWFCASPVARLGLSYCSEHMHAAFPMAKVGRQTSAERLAMIKVAVARRRMAAMDSADATLARIMAASAAAGERAVAQQQASTADGGADPAPCSVQPDPPALGHEGNEPARISAPEEITDFSGGNNSLSADRAVEEIGSTPALRKVEVVCLGEAEPDPITTGEPIFERANPADLLVEVSYQRELTPKSVALIRKIALGWDWRKFRPPVVVFTEDGCLIVDGQHTTIAAASRGLESIPIQIVEAPEVESRAEAFIGLNRDRLQVTPVQLHHAAVAAGEETAVTIEQVCHRAGVTVVRAAWGAYKWKPGETMAVNAIRDLIGRRGAMKARMILQALAQAGCAPIAANEIKAAEHLFTHEDFAGELEPIGDGGAADLALVIKALGDGAAKDAKMFAATHCVPYWKGLAATWFKKCRKRRKAA